jgi:hypothetical protein
MLRAPTAAGDVYFKAAAPAHAHEAALTEVLARRRPDCTAELIAVDAGRGWLLMRDGGETLSDLLEREPRIELLEPLLALNAQLQIELAPLGDELVALGVPDRRLERLPELAEGLGVDGGLVGRLIADAAPYDLPETLVHEEVHRGNVLVRDGSHVFVDWSDSSVGHPFFGVVVALRSAADAFALEPGAPELERLLDTYLEPWTALAPRERLRTLFPPAYRLGMLNRALSWQATVAPLEPPLRDEYAPYVEAWLEEFRAAESPQPGT